ncbi:hypothetical protein [Peribacillus asahii]|uniref:hypothetical protein n=1 Tax=Peribacillus asahii TaxID=228899 RepID=UPI00382F01BB
MVLALVVAVTDVVVIAAIVSRNHHLVITDVDVDIDVKNHHVDVKNHQIETEITSI